MCASFGIQLIDRYNTTGIDHRQDVPWSTSECMFLFGIMITKFTDNSFGIIQFNFNLLPWPILLQKTFELNH